MEEPRWILPERAMEKSNFHYYKGENQMIFPFIIKALGFIRALNRVIGVRSPNTNYPKICGFDNLNL